MSTSSLKSLQCVCEAWSVKTWNKLRRFWCVARWRAIQRGRRHWTVAFPQIEAWITNQPASIAASSEPGSKISSIADSADHFSVHNQIISTEGSVYGDFEVQESFWVTTNIADTALPAAIMALPATVTTLTPGTIQTSVHVPIIGLPQTTPSASGSTEGVSTVPFVTSTTEPQLQSLALP